MGSERSQARLSEDERWRRFDRRSSRENRVAQYRRLFILKTFADAAFYAVLLSHASFLGKRLTVRETSPPTNEVQP